MPYTPPSVVQEVKRIPVYMNGISERGRCRGYCSE